MRIILKNLVHQLKIYSSTLDRTTILVDKPWALIDDEMELQKLIFKRNKELILSKNGQVQIGKWDYYPEAKSLLIDRNSDKILCNEGYIDNGVMILKLDGTDNRYFLLANENVVPDLNVEEYLKNLKHQKLYILEINLADGRVVDVYRENKYYDFPKVGDSVKIDSDAVEDGKHRLEEPNKFIEIVNGKIHKILIETSYQNPEKQEILIQQQHSWGITNGDYAFMYGKKIINGIISFSKYKYLVVKDGKVTKFKWKNPILDWLFNFLGFSN
jgi:hypothetical protein